MARNRRRRSWRVALPVTLLVLVLTGGYAAADVLDIVPGVLTMRPAAADHPPFGEMVPPEREDIEAVGDREDAPLPDEDALVAARAELMADPAVGTAGVLVTDVLTGDRLDAAEATTGHTPASTTKLLTATAAVALAGADQQFTTRVVRGEEDHIVLVAGGDLTLAAGRGDPEAVIGHAGLADLAEETAQALGDVDEVRLAVDLSYYTGPDMPPRWDEIDLAVGDAMHMAPLAIELGRQEGTRTRVTDPAGDAVAAFVDALEDAGVDVTGEVAQTSASGDAEELAAVRSAPLHQVAAYMLQHSENILAEAIGRLVAHEAGAEPSFAGSGAAVADALAGLGIDVDELELHDCSGLSSTNRIAPQTLVQTLLTIQAQPELGAVARGLPVAGLEGTLSARLDEPPAAGMIAAKTGTLRAVAALAGYLTTADGRLLAFAVMVGDVPSGGIPAAREAIDSWATSVASA